MESSYVYLAGAAVALFGIYKAKQTWDTKGIPGPTPLPLIGNAHLLNPFDQIHNIIYELCCQYGPVMQLFLLNKRFVYISDPELARQVLFGSKDLAKEPEVYKGLEAWIGLGLVTNSGEFWKRQRRLIEPLFSKKTICGALDPVISRIVTETLSILNEKASSKASLELDRAMRLLTMDIIVSTALGYESNFQRSPDHEFVQAYEDIFKEHHKQLFFPMRRYYPWVAKEATKNLRIVNDYVYTAINNRKSGKSKKKSDLLQLLLDAENPETKETLSTQHIRDEVVTFIAAGYDTTGQTIAFTIYEIARNPEVQKKVIAEVDALFESGEVLTLDSYSKLEYLTRTWKETLRVHPPIPLGTWRTSGNEEIKVDKYIIPKQTTILAPTICMHRDAKCWENPDKFDPDRWLSATTRAPCSWMPFSRGPRNCVGLNFAQVESLYVLANLYRNFTFELLPESRTVKEVIHISLQTENGIHVNPIPRKH